MATPLNLTLNRGPSVWENQRTWSSNWRTYGIAAGAVIAGAAWRSPENRQWLMGLAVGIVGTSLLAGRLSETLEAGGRQLRSLRGAREDHAVDRASEDSFPASDPPQYR